MQDMHMAGPSQAADHVLASLERVLMVDPLLIPPFTPKAVNQNTWQDGLKQK